MNPTAATLDTLKAQLASAETALSHVRATGRDSTSHVLDVLAARDALAEATAAHDAGKGSEAFQLALDLDSAPAAAVTVHDVDVSEALPHFAAIRAAEGPADPFAGLEPHSGRCHGQADYGALR